MAPDPRRRRSTWTCALALVAMVGALLVPATAAASPAPRTIATTGGAPIATAASPDGKTLWALSEQGTATAVTAASGTVRLTAKVGGQYHCTSLAVASNAAFAGCGVVTKAGAVKGFVVVIDARKGTVERRIPLGSTLPLSLAAAPSGAKVYVASEGTDGRAEGIVSAIRVRDGERIGSADVVGGGLPLALSPSGKTLYVGSSDDPFPGAAGYRGTVTVISTATMTQTAAVALRGRPIAIALSPGGGAIHVATSNVRGDGGYVETVGARSAAVAAVTPVAGRPTALAASASALAVAEYLPGEPASGSVQIIDPVTRQAAAGMTTPATQTPVGIAAGVLYLGTTSGLLSFPLDSLVGGQTDGIGRAPSGGDTAAGFRLSVTVTPVVKGTLVAVAVRLRTSAGKAAAGQRVVVSVTGANVATRAVRTDKDGRGTAYYPAAHSGTDTVRADATGSSRSTTVRIREAVQRPTLTAKPTTKHRIAVTVQTNPVVVGQKVTIYVLRSGGAKPRWLPAGTLTTDATGWASGTVRGFMAAKTHRFSAGKRYVLSARAQDARYQQARSARAAVTVR